MKFSCSRQYTYISLLCLPEFEQFSALQQQMAKASSADVAEDAGDRVFHDRFTDKIAQVTREKALWKQGRRPEKRD